MITEKEYLDAQKIVDEYKKQSNESNIIKQNRLQEKRKENEKWCSEHGGHEYRPSGGKWSSATQRSCMYCGKTID